MQKDAEKALLIAKGALAEVEAFRWPAYSDREGDVISLAEKALEQIVTILNAARSSATR